MTWVTVQQNSGHFQPRSITVTFGDQVWSDAIATLASGETETRTLLFSYFNGENNSNNLMIVTTLLNLFFDILVWSALGVYKRNESAPLHDGRPVYIEQNKFDSNSYTARIGAEIKYCKSEEAWVFAHKNIKKNEDDKTDCPWLLKSPTTKEFGLLDVEGNWAIWTGSLQDNGHFSAVDNECQAEVDCNYHGTCDDGECKCSDGVSYLDTFLSSIIFVLINICTILSQRISIMVFTAS